MATHSQAGRTNKRKAAGQPSKQKIMRGQVEVRHDDGMARHLRVEYPGAIYHVTCRMTNHFHLVFETPGANGSAFMQSLGTAYTVYQNLRHERHGHLLDGRFKAKGMGTGAAVSTQVRKVQVWAAADGDLRRRIRRAEEALRALRADKSAPVAKA